MARQPISRLARSYLATSTRVEILPKSRLRRQCQRAYSIQSQEEEIAKLPDINPHACTVTDTITPKELVPPEGLVFGRTFTGKLFLHSFSTLMPPQKRIKTDYRSTIDHMLSVEWTASKGWFPPRITPYQNLSLDPATCVFHYAFEAFEGMKAYKNPKGELRLFRPDRNMRRLNRSAARIALPTFDGEAFTELIAKFVRMEERFIPATRGYSLYLRPTLIGTQRSLGVGPPGSALLYLIASPVGPYYPTGFRAVSLEATSYAVRAWPGGVGDRKLGANYAPCIVPQLEAAKRGYHQNLWLFGEEEIVTEVGTMNFFLCVREKGSGRKAMMTAPLDGTILEGVVRESVLELARERLGPEGWSVEERNFTMQEMAEAAEEGRLLEAFGTGTAAVVSPVRKVHWKGKDVDCGLKENEEAGEITARIKEWIDEIHYGDVEHKWSVKV